MDKTANYAARCINSLLMSADARNATAYVADDFTVKATRQRRPDKRSRQETFVVTAGKPNYAERRFIAACLRAKEPFPVKKIQLRHYQKKK